MAIDWITDEQIIIGPPEDIVSWLKMFATWFWAVAFKQQLLLC